MKILLGVANKPGENSGRQKGKSSPVKLIYWGVVDPNCNPNWDCEKGHTVNIP